MTPSSKVPTRETCQALWDADESSDDLEDDEFQPCAECDGHDACRDFGCAFKLGLGYMVRQPL